jgi:cellulose synthase operon protein YhjU
MGLWSYYFFAKFFLYLEKYIDFHVWLNLGFAILLALPLRRRWLRISRQILALPLGIALLYHDSWLPPFARTLSQAGNLAQFDARYLIELLGRFINPQVIVVLVLMSLGLAIAGRKLRLSSFVFIGILGIAGLTWIAGHHEPTASGLIATSASSPSEPNESAATPTGTELTTSLQNFYQSEAARKITFVRPASVEKPFDIVFVHICSLAWDDMDLVNERNHPLMSKFDVVFKQFNSAASYSGPAAIRLLRGSCGQPKHEDLYKPVSSECTLFNSLQNAGFQAEWLMNHDGHFGNFSADVSERGGLGVKMDDNKAARIGMHSFDDTPIYDDGDLLRQWVKNRASNPAPQVALYYNTITLHDGNRIAGAARQATNDSYHQRLDTLLNELDSFISQLAQSGRRAVVVFIPEHGAALRGDRMQISGLREIPTPAITLVPAAIKLVGFGAASSSPLYVEQPSSYLAMTQLLANLVEHNPFEDTHPSLADYVHNLPQTAFVAENEGMVMMRQNGHDMLRNPDLSWSEYLTAR